MIRPLSEEERAANWQACARYLKRYFIAAMLPLLALLWAAGYAKGLLDGYAAKPAARTEGVEHESNC